jgi:hypothetical protein
MSLIKNSFAALVWIFIPIAAFSQPWNQFPLAGAGSASTAGRITAVSRRPNTMEVFWIGPNGTVENKNYYDGVGWRGFTLAGPNAASTTGGISAVSRSSNTIELFYIGSDGSVQDAYFYEGGPWIGFTLAGPGSASKVGGIAAVSRSSNTMEVFWIGPNGTVENKNYYDGVGWRGFTLAGPNAASTTGAIAAISRSFNTIELFYTGADASIQDAYFYEGGPWRGFTLAPSGSASNVGGIAAVSRDPRCMDVWWIGPVGDVQDANWNDGTMGCEYRPPRAPQSGWYQSPLSSAGSASTTSGIAAASRSSNTIDLFWIAPDDHVQHAYWYPNAPLDQWGQSAIGIYAGSSSGVAAVSRNFDTTELWWSGPDRSIQDAYWYSPPSTGYDHLTPLALRFRWLVLKCTLSDNRTVPEHLDSLINSFLTEQGAGTGNITDYFSDVSYGAASLSGTVYGWYPAPFNGTEPGIGGPTNRYKVVEGCAEAVSPSDAATIDFGSYWGIIVVTNHLSGGGACGDGPMTLQIRGSSYSLACVVFDPDSMFTSFAAHEVGHGMGMPHSFDTFKSCEYCDPWDIMSALNTYKLNSLNYPSAGPGPNVMHMGWLPSGRVASYSIGSPDTTFTLNALSHPLGSAPLAVTISTFPFLFTVEYRQKDGWDAGIPNDAVILHVYIATGNPYSYLYDNGSFDGSILAGQTLRLGTFRVRVNSTGGPGGTASITVGPAGSP